MRYDDLQRPIVSADAKHVAYVVKKDGKWQVMVDDREGAEYDHAIEAVSLSADGRHVAYTVRAGTQWRVVWDGKEGAALPPSAGPTLQPRRQAPGICGPAGRAVAPRRRRARRPGL